MKNKSREDRIITMALQLLEKRIQRSSSVITTTEQAKGFIRLHLEHQEREIFMALYLNNQHQLIASEATSLGTIAESVVYPREIVKRAMEHNAAAVILAHNHPSGYAEPSAADRTITERIASALDLVGTRILDHLVIGHGESVSFAERGWL
ncbi:DNA repair protein RadC [Leminorella grimontii]|uniref:DNA repair protein RadC n=1 Tax=Leminorella grimontii TaxID=82981 RepID=A0AAV5MZF4_9GAMM|nr:DNA repair protein RadC [Leminorella grimontii]KFC97396.1 DNA repair protein [Leminorella grimontii ATCC 33999 = DSM 5078]GKX55245.1 DNA repair protein RadC [Leminorella grimontii]VFS56722.1 DNA repair protein RadC [Leminorella grimontii]